MNNRQCYFIYPRDKNGKLTGHSICVMMHDGKVFHGTSLCSPKDNFNKTTGRDLAYKRAVSSIERHESRAAKEPLLTRMVKMLKGE